VLCGGVVVSSNSWEAGKTYYVFTQDSQTTGGNYFVRMNLSGSFYSGYITDSIGNSVPISPNIPGFTDVGIATTSQQVWCYGNFSTSTGFMDNIGQAIAIGVCNVGAFLFMPSTGAISQWQELATTTRNKVPFSYVQDIYATFTSLSASSTQNFFSVVTDLPALGSSTPMGSILPDEIVWLSTTTISTYLPDNIRLAMLAAQRMFIWLGFGFMIYRRIVPHKVKI